MKIYRLRKEVDTVLGAKTDISFDDINKLEYTGAVFKEALRKWPPASEFSKFFFFNLFKALF